AAATVATQWEIDAGVLNPIDDTNDFAIGSRTIATAALGVDESANIVYIGDGALNGNTTVVFKAGTGGTLQTGNLLYTTADQFQFSGGDVVVDNRLMIGTTSPLATFDVRGNSGSTPIASFSGSTTTAGLLVDNSGTGDIFTASTGGVSKFTIQNNGTLVSSAYQQAGGVLYTDSTGLFKQASNASANTVLHGGANPIFSAVNLTTDVTGILPTTSGGSPFDAASGSIFERNTTQDFLLGSQATSSAKFAILNVNSGTPIATISGGTFLTGAGNLGTTNRQSLTLGGGTTGNIIIANNTIQTGATNFTTGTGLTTIGGNLTVNGTALTITNAATLDLANSQTSALNIEGGLLNFDTANSRIGIKTTTPTADLDVAGTASVAGSLTFRNGTGLIQTTQNNPLTIGGSTTGDVIISGRNASQDGIIFQNYGLGLIHSDASGRLTSSLVNLETDVLGILPSANGGSPFDAANGAIFERNTTQDFLLGGQSTASAKFAVLNVNAGTPVASLSGGAFFTGAGNFSTINNQTLTLGGSSTGNIVIDSGSSLISLVDATTLSGNFTQTGVTSFTTGTGLTTVGGTLQINGNNLTFNNANSTVTLGSSVTALNIAGGLVDLDTTGGGRVGIGTTAPLEKLDVNGNATVSGNLTLYGGARSIQSTSGNALTIGGSSTGNVIIAAQGGIGGTGVVFQGYGTG